MQHIREIGYDNHYFGDKISGMKHNERMRLVAALEIPPVVDAPTAVRASIVADSRKRKGKKKSINQTTLHQPSQKLNAGK